MIYLMPFLQPEGAIDLVDALEKMPVNIDALTVCKIFNQILAKSHLLYCIFA
jgi:hypothetical protein